MQFYMAPMQSLTGFVFRNAYHTHFHNVDKYFTPFLSDKRLSSKDLKEVLPEHNQNMTVVPQIMANKGDVFIEIAKQLEDLGYSCVNLNVGCPSGTVVPKKRGAGLLSDLILLDNLLEEIFDKCPLSISVKTRIGMESPTEWEEIVNIYQQYPLEELIIHPRLQVDQYKNHPNWDIFEESLRQFHFPVCYNGDIHSLADYQSFTERFPQVETVMLGRGILKNPGLIGALLEKESLTRHKLLALHDDVLKGYQEHIAGDINVLYKMKEWWCYLASISEQDTKNGLTAQEGSTQDRSATLKKQLKKLMKSKSITEYRSIATQMIMEEMVF